jgi:hypothetical protein
MDSLFQRQWRVHFTFKDPVYRKSSHLINNPSLKNGTLFAANSPNQAAQKVNLSKKRNLPSEHFA